MLQVKNTNSLSQWVLRIGIGIIFLYHGAAKVFLMPGAMAAFFQSIGLPGSFAMAVGIIELLGGLALFTGIAMRFAAAALSVILLGAIVKAKWAMGFVTPQGLPGWEFDFALLAGTLSLAVSGLTGADQRPAAATDAHPVSQTTSPPTPASATARQEVKVAPAASRPSASRIAVIYYSSTGNTHRMAEAVAEGARQAGAEVRLLKVEEVAPESAINQNPAWRSFHEQTKDEPIAKLSDLEWADGIIMGSPTRFGTVAAQLKQFIDTTGGLWFQGKLANKVVAGFVTASNDHGGQEATVLTLYTNLYHWGAIVVPPGFTDQAVFEAGGNPYGASALGTDAGPTEKELAAARHLGKRIATFSATVVANRAVTA
jgi:NAD(P)H dehydrogenase (quinone)